MFIRRLARRFAKPVFISPPFMLEQLEDRIVMDAAVPATPDNQPDNHAAAAAAPDAAANPAAGQDPAAAANPASAQGNSGDSASSSQSSDPAHSSASPSEVFSTPLSDVLISIAPDAGQDASHSAAETPHNDVRVLVVSSTLQDADKLAAAAAPDIITVMYDGSADTPSTILSVIENALAGKKADSIAFAGHELGDGKFSLTPDSSVDLVTVATDAQQQAFWEGVGGLLSEDGRVDLMVCNLGATAAGDALVSQLEILTGHDVAASDDPTGNPQAGGDWTLEYGNVDLSAVYFDAAALSQYQGILADTTPVLSLNTNAGSLDPTFSEDGKVTTDLHYLGYGDIEVNATAIQSDGKIVVVGEGYSPDYDAWSFVVLRYNSDGSADTTFSDDGIAEVPLNANAKAYAVAIDANDNIVVAGVDRNDFCIVRLTSTGDFDNTFGNDGMVYTNMGGSDVAYGVAIDSNNHIVVAGTNGSDFAVVRYNTNGSLDNTFDGDGKLITDFAGGEDKAYSVAIAADGKIVVAGYAHLGYYSDIAVARYTTTGDLDTTFSGDGKVTTDVEGSDDEARSVAIQADGKIVVAGYGGWEESSISPYAALVRYTTTGDLDTTFSGDGIWWGDGSDWYGRVHVLAIQSDGKIVLAGDCEYDRFRVDRFNTDGSREFGVLTDVGANDQAYAVAIQSDGKIVVAGRASDDFAVARYDASQMAYNAGDGAKVIDANITLTDADSANMASATVEITGNYQSGQDTLGIAAGYTLPSGVTAVWTAGTLTISGVAAKAQYDDILEHVTYTNSSGSPNDAPRTLSWTVNDGTSNSVTKSSTITVTGPSNTAPTVEAAIPDVTVDEDATDTVFSLYPHFQDAEDTDAQLTYTVANNTNSGLFTAVSIDGSGNLGLDYAPDAYGAADITIRATDTGGSYVEDTFRGVPLFSVMAQAAWSNS